MKKKKKQRINPSLSLSSSFLLTGTSKDTLATMPKAFLIRKNISARELFLSSQWQPVTPPPSPEDEDDKDQPLNLSINGHSHSSNHSSTSTTSSSSTVVPQRVPVIKSPSVLNRPHPYLTPNVLSPPQCPSSTSTLSSPSPPPIFMTDSYKNLTSSQVVNHNNHLILSQSITERSLTRPLHSPPSSSSSSPLSILASAAVASSAAAAAAASIPLTTSHLLPSSSSTSSSPLSSSSSLTSSSPASSTSSTPSSESSSPHLSPQAAYAASLQQPLSLQIDNCNSSNSNCSYDAPTHHAATHLASLKASPSHHLSKSIDVANTNGNSNNSNNSNSRHGSSPRPSQSSQISPEGEMIPPTISLLAQRLGK